jgi:hypothetical protein
VRGDNGMDRASLDQKTPIGTKARATCIISPSVLRCLRVRELASWSLHKSWWRLAMPRPGQVKSDFSVGGGQVLYKSLLYVVACFYW